MQEVIRCASRFSYMDIKIDKSSSVPLKDQIAMQVIFEIAARNLSPGDKLPSVRALARRLGIAEGTVGAAYKYLVWQRWLTHKHARGSYLIVRSLDKANGSGRPDLDGIIDEAIRRAMEAGYTLHELRRRASERLEMAPPDRVLIVED